MSLFKIKHQPRWQDLPVLTFLLATDLLEAVWEFRRHGNVDKILLVKEL